MDKIETLATQFRQAIEAAQRAEVGDDIGFFKRFPRGCCGDATDLLGEYLLEHGIASVHVVGIKSPDRLEDGVQSHAWLEVDGLIVDITGDQFSDREEYYNYSAPVYYGEMDEFHRKELEK